MEKWISLFTAVLLISILTSCMEANPPEAASPKEYVEKYLVEAVLETVRAEDHEDFHFSASENIQIGELHQQWRYSKAFLENENDTLEKTDDWYAAVYQEGRPVNVVAISKNESGYYSFMGIGFGKDLAESLDKRTATEGKLIYEFPMDAWFVYDKGHVIAVNDAGQRLLGLEKIRFDEFQQSVYDRYADK